MTKRPKNEPATDHIGMLGKMPFNPMNDPQLKAWSDLGAEVMHFASARMQQDLAAQKAMLACKSPEDLQKVQAQYYKEALADYSAQIQRALQVMLGAASKQPGDDFPSTRRGYDDVPV